jgi:hypothetical protein
MSRRKVVVKSHSLNFCPAFSCPAEVLFLAAGFLDEGKEM